MRALKRVVVAVVAALACAGVYGALRNMPVVSGCGFYADCPSAQTAAGESTRTLTTTSISAAGEVPAP